MAGVIAMLFNFRKTVEIYFVCLSENLVHNFCNFFPCSILEIEFYWKADKVN
jgi:hypothetical protein